MSYEALGKNLAVSLTVAYNAQQSEVAYQTLPALLASTCGLRCMLAGAM